MKGELIPLIQRIEDAKQRVKIDDSFIKRKFPISIQKKLCTEVAVKLGYSLNEGRLDISAHPFTSRIHRTGKLFHFILTLQMSESLPDINQMILLEH